MSNKAEMDAYCALVAFRNARAAGENGLVESQDFQSKVSLVDDFERKTELHQIFTAMNFAQAGKVFEAFGKAAKGFAEIKDAFELSKKLAEDGKEDLFFPSAASELSTIASTVKALKEATDSLVSKTGSLTEAFEQKDAQALIDEAKQARSDIGQLLTALEDLKNAMPA
ncbi:MULTISPECIES: hypothetical protein [Alteromonas]|jgi:VIT1/CCC1 family predicted Fe2+/Mn2+ transporter|uniref:hypothetical protein n=1 Tax=Alteromonas TaxID=226 RepID=UPI00057E4AF2|nr:MULTISPECIES: hypothetical protein [Alteromonas]KHT57092.1 hypothetical protein RJ43_01630 [Alteromonas macleodii]CAI2388982.1 hypothetical protein ALT831_00900 [Alteromonas macleodii]CAI3936897.1 hypothetical protein ALTBGP9_00830 [Alteromonas macleodii]CAI3937941.1 hypothetical protein ALTBGP6_00900 [Alteromonas macleodii]CAI3937990.1 hypothetical protein ALTBGP14_00900 [Alteromonas macleodii]|tara:strand:- start:7248 stop:7754 length:507 start_codon:yes stop_codon:yes gene_type:complete